MNHDKTGTLFPICHDHHGRRKNESLQNNHWLDWLVISHLFTIAVSDLILLAWKLSMQWRTACFSWLLLCLCFSAEGKSSRIHSIAMPCGWISVLLFLEI